MPRTLLVLLIAGFTAAAVAKHAEQTFTSWPIRETRPELRMTISSADIIIVSMQDAMLRQLVEALDRGGPASAVGGCHLDAIAAAHRVGREGIAAGRTSDRLRSPTNVAPAWAAQLVKDNAGKRSRDVDGFAVDLGSKLGVLRPIAQRPICASCHGPSDRISPAVHQLLTERYPVDRAVGFTDGEIRGWFWVEMPKTR